MSGRCYAIAFGWALFGLTSTLSAVSNKTPSDEQSLEDRVNELSYDDLLNSHTVVSAEDLRQTTQSIWSKYQASVRSDKARTDAFNAKALPYSDKVMRFSLKTKGPRPANGYPLYIALHGGGSGPSSMNDSQWSQMQTYYYDGISSGIYVATRGITDTWNLHFVEDSYTLYDELIADMIALNDVDPNRVYLTGFSAGGDGVYQIVPRMPDRFAAANMSAGHHNWIRFDNLFQTPFLLQVGENDSAYKRNTVAAENFVELNRLQALRGGYIHDLFVHAGGSHNSWSDRDPSGADHTILKDPQAWLSSGNRETARRDTNAIHWMDRYQRNPYPTRLVWDPKINAKRERTSGSTYVSAASSSRLAMPKDLFYWIDLSSARSAQDASIIDVSYEKESNTIHFAALDGIDSIKVLLRDEMIDFAKPVNVVVRGESLGSISVHADLSIMTRTLLERGDPSFIFQSEITLNRSETNDAHWEILKAGETP